MQPIELSLVIPVHNEGDNLAPLAAEIKQALSPEFRFEIIFVDDGSSDDSRERLRQLRSRYPEIRPLFHRRCHGQSRALITGIRRARSPLIVTLDGDGQNDPADIEKLLRQYLLATPPREKLLITGRRKLRRDNLERRLASRIANLIRGGLLGDETPDTGCGLKLFPRELFLELPHFDHMHRFLPALVKGIGGRTISVDVNHRPRDRGRSHYGTWKRLGDGLIDLFGVIWLMKRSQAVELEEE